MYISTQKNFLSAVFVLLLSSTISFGQTDICPGADVVVSTVGMTYAPTNLVVDVGTTVGWVNYGGFHDVNGVNNSITTLPFYNPESFYLAHVTGTDEGVCIGTHTFTIPGDYTYDCTTQGHAQAGMVAYITVMEVIDPTTNVTFSVDMNGETVSANGVHVAGSFQGWDPSTTELYDFDMDGVYETTASFIPDSTQSIIFKFVNFFGKKQNLLYVKV